MKYYLFVFSLFISLNSFAKKLHCSDGDLIVRVSSDKCRVAVEALFSKLKVDTKGQLGIKTLADHEAGNLLYVALTKIENPQGYKTKGDVKKALTAGDAIHAADDYLSACSNPEDKGRLLSIKDCLALKITDYQVKKRRYDMIGDNCLKQLDIKRKLQSGSQCSSLVSSQKVKLSSVIQKLERAEGANSGLGGILDFCGYSYEINGKEFKAVLPVDTALVNPECWCAADLRLLKQLQGTCSSVQESVVDSTITSDQTQQSTEGITQPSSVVQPTSPVASTVTPSPTQLPNPFPGNRTQGPSQSAQIVLTQAEIRDQTEVDRSRATAHAVDMEVQALTLESGGCVLLPFSNSTIKEEITIPNAKEYFYGCKKGIPTGTVSCANGVLSTQPRCNTLGQAKPCRGSRVQKYQCYKGNIATGFKNVFEFYAARLQGTLENLEFAKSLRGKKLSEINVQCKDLHAKSKAIKKAKKSFISEFCDGGKIKKRLKNHRVLAKKISRFIRGAKRAKSKAYSKYKVELKQIRAQSLWFSRHFMRELKNENGELNKCLDTTAYIKKAEGGGSCFYSALDVAACLRDSDRTVVADWYQLDKAGFAIQGSYIKCREADSHATASDSHRRNQSVEIRDFEGGSSASGRIKAGHR
jgi:hypothetical protein